MQTPTYRFLPHTTDAYIEVEGSTFEEALESAGASLIDTMCDLKSVDPVVVDAIEVEGADESALLYDWLEAILLKFELEQKVFTEFRVKLTLLPTRRIRLNAVVRGERYDRRKHGAKVEVKGVTYHMMEISKGPSVTVLRFILDL